MAELSRQALFIAMELLQKYDETKAENVLKLENKVDHYEDRLGTYLIRLSSRDLIRKKTARPVYAAALHRGFRANFRSCGEHYGKGPGNEREKPVIFG